jgi:DNA end-binding protein Ku
MNGLVAVAPLQDGLVMELLRYAVELREPAEYFDEVPSAKPQKDMVDLAVQLIEKKSAAFDPKKSEDHCGTALKELAQEKMKGIRLSASRAGKKRA